MSEGWIGVDLDRTLAYYNDWNDGQIGPPLMPMVERVRGWLAEGREVRIVTARVNPASKVGNKNVEDQRRLIEEWCLKHLGHKLPVTCEKDFAMLELWDDRAVQVVANVGVPYRLATR